MADIAWAVYGARSLIRPAGKPGVRSRRTNPQPYIGWDESSRRIRAADWVEKVSQSAPISYRTGSLVHQLVAAKAGLGLAVLPCYLGDPEPGLVRAAPATIADLTDELWIVTHVGLKRTARVRAFLELVGEGLMRERDLIAGRRSRS